MSNPNNNSILSFEQKSALLRAALSNPFTTKSTYLNQIWQQLHGQFTLEQVEEFFGEVVDFEALKALEGSAGEGVVIKNENDIENFNQHSIESESIESKESLHTQVIEVSEGLEFFEDNDQRTPSPTNSNTSITSKLNLSSYSSSSLSSTPLLVPVRTPSGRTLRSNSTVNTSEPRRLRSNK